MRTNQYRITDIHYRFMLELELQTKYWKSYQADGKAKIYQNIQTTIEPQNKNFAVSVDGFCSFDPLYYILFDIWWLTFKLEWDSRSCP